MAEAVKYISKYGISLLVIACIIIACIGILKACKVFNKIPSANVKKVLYYALDIAFAFAFAAIYFALSKHGFAKYLAYTGAEICVVTTLYAVYENFGVRKLLEVVVALIQKALAKKKNVKLTKIVEQLGIENSLIEIQNMITAAKQNNEQKGS